MASAGSDTLVLEAPTDMVADPNPGSDHDTLVVSEVYAANLAAASPELAPDGRATFLPGDIDAASIPPGLAPYHQRIDPGIESIRLEGTTGHDVVAGPGDNAIEGNDGGNQLHGGEGDDRLDGGAGADRLFGGAGADLLAGGLEADHLEGGLDDDTLFGGAGNDELLGQEGANVLRGGEGDDFLLSNGVQDVLLGGGDKDLIDLDVCQDAVADAGPGDDEVWLWAPEDAVVTLGEGRDRLVLHHRPGGDHSATVLDYAKGEDIVAMGAGWSEVALRKVDGDTILEARGEVGFTIRFVDAADGIDLSF
jgi:Ca2+-binding RTX toxin-like protein